MRTKLCAKCRTSKAVDAFARSRGTRDGLQSYCKSCSREAGRKRYAAKREEISQYWKNQRANNPAHRERQKRWHAERHRRNRERSQALKLERGCEHCGLRPDDPALLHWDHVDSLSKWVHGGGYALSTKGGAFAPEWTWGRIEAELAKCQVLCQPCHIEKTRRGGEYRHVGTRSAVSNAQARAITQSYYEEE
jgi:hypothetical protein